MSKKKSKKFVLCGAEDRYVTILTEKGARTFLETGERSQLRAAINLLADLGITYQVSFTEWFAV